jgi:hypothetical protein
MQEQATATEANAEIAKTVPYPSASKSSRQVKRKVARASAKTAAKSKSHPVVGLDASSTPVQEKDVSPINPVGFEQGKYEYVRPTADKVEVPGQKFWVMSYVSPEGEHARSKNVMVKCSGCFADEKSANERAAWVRSSDPRISVFVVDMYVLVSVPVPLSVFQGVKKNYMDEKLDKIMHQNYLSVQRDRMEMERRKAADRQKALQNMRAAMGDQTYEPKQDHREFLKETVMGSTAPKMEDVAETPAEYGGEEIVEALEFAMKMAKMSGSDGDGAAAEQFAANMMKQLVEKKTVKMCDEKAERDKGRREGYRGLCTVPTPAVSDTMIPEALPKREASEGSCGDEDTI